MLNSSYLQQIQPYKSLVAPQILNRRGDDAELYLYAAIKMDVPGWNSITAPEFVEQLKQCKGARNVLLHMNCPGGDVFDGMAIYNEFARFPAKKTVVVDGVAGSIGSVIAMGADRIVMAPGSRFMIHEAQALTYGNAADMKRTAETLEAATKDIRGIYAKRTKQTDEQLQELMKVDTYLSAEKCVELGFADCIEERNAPVIRNALTFKPLSPIEVARLRRDLIEAKQR